MNNIINLMIAFLFSVGTINMVYADPNALEKAGRAPCTVGDGYQTVRFDNGATYSGSFQNCRPLAGPAIFEHQGVRFSGYAKPIDNNKVVLESDLGSVTITLDVSYH